MGTSKELHSRISRKRFAVVGVGNALKGDDGAGPALIALLAGRARVPFVDASEVPENYGGWVAKQGVDIVLFVDAVDFGGAPGEWRLIGIEDLMHSASSTHRLSLHFLVRYLKEQWKGEAILIGIQPKSMKLGEVLSPEVEAAVSGLAGLLIEAEAGAGPRAGDV
jgi:hydrogenase 3 maturation protease